VTRHIFKLVWNRKRATGLILLELLICFLVLCGLMSSVARTVELWRQPLGFDYENIWMAEIEGINYRAEDEEGAANRRAVADMLRAVQTLPEVTSAAVSTNLPYVNGMWAEGTWIDGQSVRFLWTLATPSLMDVLGLNLLHGRWIEETDGALGHQPVVLSSDLALDLFGTENPVGRDMPVFDSDGQITEPEGDTELYRVVGVLDPYRRYGEFREPMYMMFLAVDFEAGELPTEFLIRVRPGTTAAFEEKLVRTMQDVVPGWSYDTALMTDARRQAHRSYIGPILTAAIVSAFLIVMVGLGLVGVLWQSVTRRTAELGLRRAVGASIGAVRTQILAELWALTAIAVVVGGAIFLQFPLLGANFGAGWPVFIMGMTAAMLILYAFVTICGLYPTWLATRIRPASALQYE